MNKIYQHIIEHPEQKFLAILIDPDKEELATLPPKMKRINQSRATHIFVGGSTDLNNKTAHVVEYIKAHTYLPVIIFPGDVSQISEEADALLFLSLISGRNPEYLINKQVKAVPQLLNSTLEIIPTGYILIDGGSNTAVERVSKTTPISQQAIEHIVHTAKAGEFLGMKLIYLEAGSGAQVPVSTQVISAVKQHVTIPLIVGGGIKNKEQVDAAYKAGANMVVVGTAFENNTEFFEHQTNLDLLLNKH